MTPQAEVLHGHSLLTDHDIYLFKEGNHFRLYEKLGAHARTVDGRQGVHYAVWAPNAREISVMGEFNGWSKGVHRLSPRLDGSGVWEGFIPGRNKGDAYKYHLVSNSGYQADKADPFSLRFERPPATASIVWDLDYQWSDGDWLAKRAGRNSLEGPMSVYEMHLGSWRRVPEEGNRRLTYLELAEQLPPYLQQMGFTHVEFLPVMEHPFYGSWGYQTLGYFAPTSRYGSPQDFMRLVEALHQAGVGVILDWVPSHFPTDEFGLGYFDGTHLFEHADPRQGYHPDWNSYIFNYGRHEVRSFLLSSAMYWLDRYHVDGLRVDAVASMLYLDYSRQEGEWIANDYGGRENIPAISFLRKFNESVYGAHPDCQTMAEESTAWPMVSRPAYVGGLGFGLKWNMGWMNDTLRYFQLDPIFRRYHHDNLTFSIWYAWSENFVLSLSHDEVVHGKGSLINKMPGDGWRQFAQMRLLLAYMWAHPGKKLLFMGAELGQRAEWNHDASLEWHLLQHPHHAGLQRFLADLNRFYQHEPALWQRDFTPDGFQWSVVHDSDQSVLAFVRQGKDKTAPLLCAFNFTPVPREAYRLGVPAGGLWREALNSDAELYGGSNKGNLGGVEAEEAASHGFSHAVTLTIPPLGAVFLKREPAA